MCYFLLLCQLVSVFSLLGFAATGKNKCDQWFEGDFSFTKNNFDRLISQEKYILVSITSDQDCVTCCGYESVIGDIWMNHFVNPKSALSGYGIKLARVNLGQESWFAALHPNFKELPTWVMYVNGHPFYIPSFHIKQKLLDSISRMVNPVESIGSLASFERFMNRTVVDINGRELLRYKLVGLFPDPEDYEDEIEHFRQSALDSYWREDSIFGLVTDDQSAKQIWRRYFSEYRGDPDSVANVLFSKSAGLFEGVLAQSRKFIITEFAEIPATIGRQSLAVAEEYTALTRVAMDPTLHTIFAFVNTSELQQATEFISKTIQATNSYPDQLQMFWVDYRDKSNITI